MVEIQISPEAHKALLEIQEGVGLPDYSTTILELVNELKTLAGISTKRLRRINTLFDAVKHTVPAGHHSHLRNAIYEHFGRDE